MEIKCRIADFLKTVRFTKTAIFILNYWLRYFGIPGHLCIDEISVLAINLAQLLLLGKIFSQFGEKMPYYVLSGFNTPEPLLKK